jgi:hypothetical protein
VAAASDAHGVISGNCPEGGPISDYACIWFEGALAHLRATGDAATARSLLPAATRCMEYFLGGKCYGKAGFAPVGMSSVVDWGYTRAAGYPVDLALNALLTSALQSLVAVAAALGEASTQRKYAAALAAHTALVRGCAPPAATERCSPLA